MAINVATARIPVETNAAKAAGDMGKLDDKLSKVDGSSKSATRALGALKKIGIAAIAAKAAQAIGRLVKQTISLASAAQETANKFRTVFGPVAAQAAAAAENLSENFGLSDQAAQDLLASTGDLLTGFGFSADAALGLSERANQLAVDLSSFANVPVEQAARALTGALTGETEALKSLGIVVRQGTNDFKDQVETLVEAEGITEAQARAQVILQQAYEQSGNAIGDFARSADSYANTQRTTKAAIEDLGAAIGELFLPAATDASNALKRLVEGATAFVESFNEVRDLREALNTAAAEQELTQLLESRALILEEINRIEERFANERQIRNRSVEEQNLEAARAQLELIERNIAFQEELARQEQIVTERQNERLEAQEREARYNELFESRTELAGILEAELAAINEAEQQGLITTTEAGRQRDEALLSNLENARAIVSELNEIAAVDIDDDLIPVSSSGDLVDFIRSVVAQINGVGESVEETSEKGENAFASTIDALKQKDQELRGSLQKTQEEAEKYKLTFSDVTDILGGFASLANTVADASRARIDAQIQALKDQGATEEEIAERRAQLLTQQSKQTKAAATFDAIVNTAAAVTKALNTQPFFPLGPINAALALAQGGAQIAAIQAQPIPRAAFGGQFTVPPGFGDDGALLRVSSGEDVNVTPARESGGPQFPDRIIVSIGGEEFDARVAKAFNSGRAQIRRPSAVRSR